MPEVLSPFDAGLRGAVMALLLLLAALLQRDLRHGQPPDWQHTPASRIGQLLCCLLSLQVFSSSPVFETQVPRAMQAPLVGLAVANAVLFWVFVQALFDDAFVLRRLHVVAWLGAVLLGTVNCALGPDAAWTFSRALQRAVPLVFALLALWAAVAHWQADLVEDRRRLRALVVFGGSLYTVAQLGLRLASDSGRLSGPAAGADILMLLLMVGGVAWLLLRVAPGALFAQPPTVPVLANPTVQSAPALPAAPPDPAQARLAVALHQCMVQQHAYRDERLSVARLAAQLGVPEYRLRRHINQDLGQRNFNAYVNAFRLDEARAVLADAALRERSVLSVALDAGFASIGPFNRAFKAATGLTPSDFRRQKLASLLADS